MKNVKKSVNLVHLQWQRKVEQELIPKIAAFQAKLAGLYAKTTLVDARMVGRRYEVLKKDDKGELVWAFILKADLPKMLLENVRLLLNGDRFVWITPDAWKMFVKLYECWSARDVLERTHPEFPHHDTMAWYRAKIWSGDKSDRVELLLAVEEGVQIFFAGKNKNVA